VPKNQLREPQTVLQSVWGYPSFRPGQEDIVHRVVEGDDGLVVLHTGGGKSLCFQVPALCRPGCAIVISPLISLMKDQVDALTAKGVAATFINSSLDATESHDREARLRSGQYKIVYVSPERLDSEGFRDILAQTDLSFVAVDEAHCVSTWGHDFRLSYRRIPNHLKDIERLRGRRLQRVAYTATATLDIRADIPAQLGMHAPFEFVGSFDRPNIELNVVPSSSKNDDVLRILETHKDEASIVYCATVKAVEELTHRLRAKGIKAAPYHGRLDTESKNAAQDAFLSGNAEVIIATNAFGMGVDKADVRNVIHYHLPGSLEAYYQEAGRSGRDGKPARSYLLYSKRDRNLQEFLIDMSYPDAAWVKEVLYSLSAVGGNDPFILSSSEIAAIAPSDIAPKYIDSILRILEDQNCIAIERDSSHKRVVGLQVLNSDYLALDLAYLGDRRKAVHRGLNAMEMFARTELCRRQYLLRHFGEQPAGADGCGNCDSCARMGLVDDHSARNLSSSTLRNVLYAVDELGQRRGYPWVRDALAGTQSGPLKRKGVCERPYFGALHSATHSDIQRLIDYLVEEKLLFKPNRLSAREGVALTASAQAALSEGRDIAVALPPSLSFLGTPDSMGGATRRQQSPQQMNKELYEYLRRFRAKLATELEKPPFMVLSDSALKNIASSPVKSKTDLQAAGLSDAQADLVGRQLLRQISFYYTSAQESTPGPQTSIPDIPI